MPTRPLPVALWLAVPVLLTAAIMGLISVFSLAFGLGAGMVPLPAPVFGATAAITLLLYRAVVWGRLGRLRKIMLGYPALVLAAGIGVSWLSLPAVVGVTVGLPAVAAVAVLYVWARSDYQLWSDSGA